MFLSFFSKHTIAKNFSILTLSNVGTQLLTLFAMIKIARCLKPIDFGSYNLLQLHVSIITVIASLGLRNIVIRDTARDRSSVVKIFLNSLIIRIPAFVLSIGFFAFSYFFSRQYDLLFFVLVALSILSSSLFDVFESIAFGLEKMQLSGMLNLLCVACWLVSMLVLPTTRINLVSIFSLFVLFSIGKTFAYYFLLQRQKASFFKKTRVTRVEVILFLKESFPYYYISLFTLLSNQIPLIFLQYRSGVQEIGYFNIANKILMPINLVVFTALATLFPTLSRLYSQDFKKFIAKTRIVFIVLAMFLIVSASTFTIFSQEIINILYGKRYLDSSPALRYQSWYIAIYLIVCCIGTILGAIDRQKELGYLSVICTIIQVPILWVGSKGGAESLSAGFLIATIISFVFHVFVITKFLNYKISLVFFSRIVAFVFIAFILSFLVPLELNFSFRVLIIMVFIVTVSYISYKVHMAQVKLKFSNNLLLKK